MEQYVAISTLAEKTQLSESFWRKAIARRLLPVSRVGRAVRVRETDVLRFLAERERPAREAGR